MACGTRATVILMAIALLAACSDDDAGTDAAGTVSPSTQTTDADEAGSSMRLTLTDDGCAYDGDETVASGSFTAEVENLTEYYGAFAIAGIAEGSTIADLEAYIAQAQQTWDESGTLPEPPAFYSQAVRAGVEAGATGLLPADVPAGTYALMCFVDDLPTWRGYVAGQLDVAE